MDGISNYRFFQKVLSVILEYISQVWELSSFNERSVASVKCTALNFTHQ